jgi:hypothetical protein
LSGATGDFDVDGASGTLLIPAADQIHTAVLQETWAQDVEILFRVQTDKLAAGRSEIAYFIGRHVSATTEYRGQIRFDLNHNVNLRAIRFNNNVATALGTEVMVAGLPHVANTYIWVRAQIVGVRPTTIRIKAWADGQSEAVDWQYTVTDSAVKLQTTGGFGLAANLVVSATNAPVDFTFDDFQVTHPGAP